MGQIMTISCVQGGQAITQLSGGTKTNLEIQKILYFANMLYIGENRNKEPLIEREFLTWPFGPAVQKLYNHIKRYRDACIPVDAFKGIEQIMDDNQNPKPGYEKEVEIIKRAYNRFGKYSPYKLVRISHWSEGAWRRSKNKGQKEIDDALILDEFDARKR